MQLPKKNLVAVRPDLGGGTVEYVIMIALVAVACIFSLRAFNGSISARFSKAGCSVQNEGVQAVGGAEGASDACGSGDPPPPPPDL